MSDFAYNIDPACPLVQPILEHRTSKLHYLRTLRGHLSHRDLNLALADYEQQDQKWNKKHIKRCGLCARYHAQNQ